ncbi:hypothetical protein JDV76_11585 [Corynebacterium sp. CCM 8864]|uniref:Type ISP restriction-modification enzyme LLaBIII C-terminal specificity domain-containing protein n=1 Tax=Corynebacterium marambiense TaxID=2765364 RepID=A0ABS0VYT5_9CORY|nr:hypothetical protein [Corynebacterium marambiense]
MFIGIKTPNAESCTIHYRDIGDYLTREEKLAIVEHGSAESIEWEKIIPNNHGDWVNQRSAEFETWPVLGDKKPSAPRIFKVYGAGLKTGRDAWCYSMHKTTLIHNITRFLGTYESARRDFRI